MKILAGSLLVLAAMVVLAAECAGKWFDAAMRLQVYAGGVAGLIVGAAGLPFAVRVSRLAAGPETERSFWRGWGGGVLARLVALSGLAVWFAMRFERPVAALLAMGIVYLGCMFAETWWAAKRILGQR